MTGPVAACLENVRLAAVAERDAIGLMRASTNGDERWKAADMVRRRAVADQAHWRGLAAWHRANGDRENMAIDPRLPREPETDEVEI